MSSNDCAIEARHLVKTYAVRGKKHGIRALDGLDISVPRGMIYGLLGPNGAGKSTTVKILTSLARPDAGTARVEGIDVLARPGQVRHVIGVVAQRSGADPTATGRENLILQGRLYGMRGGAVRARADELLGHFGLTEAAGRLVKTYSGGMQRRLDVALGLMHRPAVLFLDEPTTGLDPESRAAMWQEIARLASGEGLTVLLTTHYLEEADRLASRLAIVDRGRVVTSGTPDELKGELHGDAVHVELRLLATTPTRAWSGASWPACPRCGTWSSPAATCPPAVTTARPPSRSCWPSCSGPVSTRRRWPWRGRRSMTCTCGTPGAATASRRPPTTTNTRTSSRP